VNSAGRKTIRLQKRRFLVGAKNEACHQNVTAAVSSKDFTLQSIYTNMKSHPHLGYTSVNGPWLMNEKIYKSNTTFIYILRYLIFLDSEQSGKCIDFSILLFTMVCFISVFNSLQLTPIVQQSVIICLYLFF